MNVLIVDDREESRYMLETLLNGSGYSVRTAADGLHALEVLKNDKIDLIVSDILMPRMDGFQLCRTLKKDPLLCSVPFVFYTATYTGPKDEEFALKIGADRFIAKPCEPDVFLRTIEETFTKVAGKKDRAPDQPNETEAYKLYSERLVRKLEQKMEEVEQELEAREEAEKSLRAQKEELEKKVAERTEELQEKVEKLDKGEKAMLYMVEDLNQITLELKEERRKLKAANRELEAFSYSVSHDLRAPLRAIDGFSRILEEEYANVLDKEGRRLLRVVRDNTKKMDALITDILELSRTGRTEMSFSEIDMAAMAKAMFQEIASPEVMETFEFNVSELPSATADPNLIRRVWSNLIANAIKYTMPKKSRTIEIKGNSEEGRCIYSVRDSGVGFNPEYKGKLFKIFQRLHNADEFEGTGVGLAIVQRIINRHGGAVWADGMEGEGAVFSFSVPRRPVHDQGGDI